MKARKIGALLLALALCGATGCEAMQPKDPEQEQIQEQKEETASAAREVVSQQESGGMKKIGDPITVQYSSYFADGT